ncbi:hypothetical protein GE061_016426 [Apolygus lucorum]|uniref:Uncharacterized protein n=1 Tax=Apolygus lucorum TaxID=248454 RepID=A0A6A4JFU2_APOLU|nr:hypothetical protein GE061_016426 [Apolygus lucorum]
MLVASLLVFAATASALPVNQEDVKYVKYWLVPLSTSHQDPSSGLTQVSWKYHLLPTIRGLGHDFSTYQETPTAYKVVWLLANVTNPLISPPMMTSTGELIDSAE